RCDGRAASQLSPAASYQSRRIGVSTYGSQRAPRKSARRLTRKSDGAVPTTVCTSATPTALADTVSLPALIENAVSTGGCASRWAPAMDDTAHSVDAARTALASDQDRMAIPEKRRRDRRTLLTRRRERFHSRSGLGMFEPMPTGRPLSERER